MPRRILFYISGHGYGHARRTAQVIRALLAQSPETEVYVRTTAPARVFAGLVPADRVSPCDVDAGAAERSVLEIDAEGTLRRIADLLARRDAVLAAEVPVVRAIAPRLIVSDIPFLAAEVADAAGVPCVGVSNFDWHWIAEPFVEQFPSYAPVLDGMHRAYGKMAALLRMPLGGACDAYGRIIDVPLVANKSRVEPGDVLRRLGIDSKDHRPRVLFGMRGAIPTATLAAAAAGAPDFLFLCPTNEPGDVSPGVVPASIGADLDFSDVLNVCEAVIGKMGYGLIAECIASDTRLVWPRRFGFREDDIVEREGPSFMRMRELPHDAFQAGDWSAALRDAMALPEPRERMRDDGAEGCAQFIAEAAAKGQP